MLNFSPEKLFLVALIALVVLGPHRLPQAARTLGRFMAEMRRMSASFQDEVRDALGEPTEAFSSAIAEFRPPANLRQLGTRRHHHHADARSRGRGRCPRRPPPRRPLPAATPQPATPGPLAAPDDPALN